MTNGSFTIKVYQSFLILLKKTHSDNYRNKSWVKGLDATEVEMILDLRMKI
jgi:hypothetical protein